MGMPYVWSMTGGNVADCRRESSVFCFVSRKTAEIDDQNEYEIVEKLRHESKCFGVTFCSCATFCVLVASMLRLSIRSCALQSGWSHENQLKHSTPLRRHRKLKNMWLHTKERSPYTTPHWTCRKPSKKRDAVLFCDTQSTHCVIAFDAYRRSVIQLAPPKTVKAKMSGECDFRSTFEVKSVLTSIWLFTVDEIDLTATRGAKSTRSLIS